MADITKLHTKCRIQIANGPRQTKQVIGSTIYNPDDITAQPYDIAMDMIEKGRARFLAGLFVQARALNKLEVVETAKDGKVTRRPCSKKEDLDEVVDIRLYRAIIARMREDVRNDKGQILMDPDDETKPIRRSYEEARKMALDDVKTALAARAS